MLENPIKTGKGVFEEPLALKFIFQNLSSYDC